MIIVFKSIGIYIPSIYAVETFLTVTLNTKKIDKQVHECIKTNTKKKEQATYHNAILF